MHLKEWLFRNQISQRLMAERLDVSYIHIFRICNGIAKPSPKLARLINIFTHGQVSIDELLFPEKYKNPLGATIGIKIRKSKNKKKLAS